MKNMKKRVGSFVLAFAVMITTVLCGVTPVQAKSSVVSADSVYTTGGTAAAGETRAIPFTLDANNGLEIYIIVPSPVEVKVLLCDSNQKALTDARTASVDLYKPVEWNGQTYYAVVDRYTNVPAGDYYYGLQFAQDTQVIVDVEQINNASIQSKATITAGFTKKLSVSGAKVKSWTSRDKSIATVDKSGKVTAKKKGKTKIVATLTSGEKIDCTVTVAANNFSNTKATLNDCEYGKWGIAAYRASFDKSGNLVVKTQCVNNNGYKRLVELRNIKIVVKDVNDKTVGTYKASKMAVNVSPESAKGYTFTIKKSDLKKKKADLRNGTITVDANGYGR